MLTMSAQPNLLCFSIEGKGTDGQINRATASACSPDLLPKPAVLQREARRCAERRSVSASACVRGSGLNAFLLLDDKGREECRGGPPGAELDTLTSARMRSVAHTSRRRGDFLKNNFSVFLLRGWSDLPLWNFFELFRHSLLFTSHSILKVLHF